MATLMLVAGESTNSLKNFLQERGSFEVLHSFDSLYRNSDVLKNGIYRVDKLVYVYNDENATIRQDMRILQELLLGDSFFSVGEIVFFVSEPDVPEIGLNYFKAVMQEVSLQAEKNSSVMVPSYSIEKSEDVLKFDMIYNALLGMTQGQNITNTYSYLYRVEKNNSSKKAYEPEDTTGTIEEPFSYQKVVNYKTLQKTADLTDSGQLIISYGDGYVPDKQDVDLGSVDYTDLTQKVDIVLISGNRKSGVSTFSAAMAVSQVSGGKKVSLLDLSSNKGLEHVLDTGNVPYSKWSMSEILTSETLKQEHDVSIINDFKDEIKIHVLRHVLSNIHRFECQTLYIDVNFEDFSRVVEQLKRYKFKTFLMSCPDVVDVKEINKLFKEVNKADLVLSGHIKYQKQYKAMEPNEIKRTIDNLNRLVAPIEFLDFDLDDNWVNVLLEVK